jgi:hypothetical protein
MGARQRHAPDTVCVRKGDVMAEVITRVYPSYETALAVVGELKAHRFTDTEINMVSYLGGQRAGSNVAAPQLKELADAIAAGFVLRADANVYAQAVAKGGTLITVRPPFGTGGKVVAILDSHNPIETGVQPKEYPAAATWDEAAPASSVLRLPTLLAHTASFSSFWNLPLLSKQGRTLFSTLRIPEVLSAAASSATLFSLPAILKGAQPISGLIGLPTLSQVTAPLSSVLHIKLLVNDKAFSAFCDLDWLRSFKTPLSSLLGLPTLLNGTTSLSSLTGLPTLSGSRPLSSLIGLPTLAKNRFLRS